jgi:hypothetical protein
VVRFTPTNTVTAIGTDICQHSVTAAADCYGPIGPLVLVIGTANFNSDGFFSLSFFAQDGKWYYLQYKDVFTNPWSTFVPGMLGTGTILIITDPTNPPLPPIRFYRIMTP